MRKGYIRAYANVVVTQALDSRESCERLLVTHEGAQGPSLLLARLGYPILRRCVSYMLSLNS